MGARTLPLVGVSVGGGGDGGVFLRTYLAGLADCSRAPVLSYVVTGPLLPKEDRDGIMVMTDALPNVRVVDFDPDFAAVVRAADAVVCMGGYNSIVESVFFGKRPIVMPRVPGSEEQLLRAEGFARLGLATVVGPDPLDTAALWNVIDRELGRADPPARTVDFDGLDCIARDLASLAAG
jgi:predicted glycosyltransferase